MYQQQNVPDTKMITNDLQKYPEASERCEDFAVSEHHGDFAVFEH
jgi:hypothetical protein